MSLKRRRDGALSAARWALLLCCAPLLLGTAVAAQTPSDISRERADYLAWLTSAVNSPLAALAQQPVGESVELGPADADIPLSGIGVHRVVARGGTLSLQTPSGDRPLSAGRPVSVGRYTLLLTASPAGAIVTVFGSGSRNQPPGYYPYDPSLVFTGPLLPPEVHDKVRVLAADGIETEAAEAGAVIIPLGGRTRLRVLRIPTPGGEESELEIFFRDESNGHGTYPAGRFVSLVPLADGAYRLDLNRAQNPFCAYNSVYPCPAPWRGNAIGAPVRAGERYAGSELSPAPTGSGER